MANQLAMDKSFAINNLRAASYSERRIAQTLGVSREASRLHSLATLTDQHQRDRQRLETVSDQLLAIETATPDRVAILRAVKDFESLWEHLTIGEPTTERTPCFREGEIRQIAIAPKWSKQRAAWRRLNASKPT